MPKVALGLKALPGYAAPFGGSLLLHVCALAWRHHLPHRWPAKSATYQPDLAHMLKLILELSVESSAMYH